MEIDETQIDKYIESMVKKREDDFTRDILKPLFESMGYDRVDFNGGPLERGRDLIAMREIPPNIEFHVTYVQSKKIGRIQNTTTAANFTQLIHQLRQCCSGKIKTISGEEVKANNIFLACPERISNRFIEEIGSQLDGFNQRVDILDGPKIITLIKKYKPDLLSQLSTIEDKLLTTCNSELINSELIAALKSKNKPEISNFYSDLSFFVGSVDSNSLLHLDLYSDEEEFEITGQEWESIKDEVKYFKCNFDTDILTDCNDTIENKYKEQLIRYNSNSNISKIQSLDDNIEMINYYESESLVSFKKIRELINSRVNRLIREDRNLEILEYKQYVDEIEAFQKRKSSINKTLSENDPEIASEVDNLVRLVNEINKFHQQSEKLKAEIIPEPLYNIQIDIQGIKDKIQIQKKSYFSSVEKINNHTIGLSNIPRFLNEIEQTLLFISKLSQNDSIISKFLTFKYEKKIPDRVSISPHDIFATSHDIAVYGGAGVGKTTTLQAFANMHSDSKNKIIIYIPLNRLSEEIQRRFQSDKSRDFVSKNLLLKIILLSKKILPTPEKVDAAKLIIPTNLCVILDGLDEIYNTIPEIIAAIAEFKKEYPNTQVIISSRDCVSYLSDIIFLGITLLPFTEMQLSYFIKGWLKEEEVAEKLLRTIKELNLYDHIKTPLLATIACALAEKGIKPPSTESEIYYERLRLLTGEYDQHKNIDRQSQKGDLLIKCARSVAYKMHKKKTRTLTKNQMYSFLCESLGDNYETDLLRACIDELINPCNIIVKDNISDKYTFGHFRFQEHLVALELIQNRSIQIYSLIVQDWWRGTLTLYAQENDFSEIFEDVYREYSTIKNAIITFEAMISARPKSKRKDLRDLLNRYKESDALEEAILAGNNEYESYTLGYGHW